ncbi:proline-rich receptor-like protein kinase PERK2 [Cucumis melo var. makuwa]|uniref:Protein PELPK1-like n=2 Tax=Cucumis melo TaxID=3656 RepID=A0A9I9DWA9_CUCME|nr:protein PELPK1-like [Cucumis melo]KAA0056641.1 proline-rich receptor-like protein kinase PERK2 [Cucumis melo var. makuwa]TYK07567.1 proline-rich receptor-like protein kinase PERK2 [Cucumis melo var. makuwa]
MASSKFLIIAFMATLALSSIDVGQAARHLLQTAPPLVPNLPVIPTGIPPLPALSNPTLPNLPQPTLPKVNLPPLPSSPVNIPSGLALPPLPNMALPNFPSIPTIPTSFPSIPFLSPPPATSSSP